MLIGQQCFDGLTRPTSLKVGGRTRTYGYVAAQLPATSLTMADGKSITYQYVHELGDQFKQVKPANEPADDLTYEPTLGLVRSREGALGRQTMTYTPSGQPLSDTWRVEGVDHVTHWQHSLQGLLLSFEDPSKVKHVREFDASGRICHVTTEQTACIIEYDELSRPCKYTTTASATSDQLVQSLTYDEFGREATRTFTTLKDGLKRVIVQSLTYTDLDQVRTRQWVEGSVTNEETYRYDALGRLVHYTASPGAAQDSFGNCVVEQSYAFNLLDG